ncbi:MAG: M48 family metalloprotease [Xanthomonadales bacterium]|nr:M48 family metalloprotease [Xanthomonadales bacterium]
MIRLALVLCTQLASAAASDLDTALEAFSERLHQAYLDQGRLVDQPPEIFQLASAQVQALYPETPLEFFMLADPSPNALSLANGHIYFNLGLLADLRGIEDLLFVLAHEASHVANRHVALKLQEPGEGLAEAVEIQADRDALERLARPDVGWATSGIELLLTRLDQGQSGGRGDRRRTELRQSGLFAPGHIVAADGASPQALARARQAAVELLLAHGRLDPVKRLLADVGTDEPLRRAWAAEMARLSGQLDRAVELAGEASVGGNLQAQRTLALALQQQGRNAQALAAWRDLLAQQPGAADADLLTALVEQGCREPGPMRAAAGPRLKFGDLRVPRVDGVRVALQTGEKLILTPNAARLTRIDLHRPESASPSCEIDLPGQQQSLIHLRQEYQPEKLMLDRIASLPGRGIVTDLHYVDRDALRWRVRQYLLVGRDTHVRLILTAPALNYFEAAADAAETMALGLGRP